MPLSDVHKKKLKKNLTVLAMILLWCALIWVVTMIKIANAHGSGDGPADNYKRMSAGEIQGVYLEKRAAHLEKTLDTQEQWVTQYHDNADARDAKNAERDEQRITHHDKAVQDQESWVKAYHDNTDARNALNDERERQREDHFAHADAQPQLWWDDWTARQPYDN